MHLIIPRIFSISVKNAGGVTTNSFHAYFGLIFQNKIYDDAQCGLILITMQHIKYNAYQLYMKTHNVDSHTPLICYESPNQYIGKKVW